MCFLALRLKHYVLKPNLCSARVVRLLTRSAIEQLFVLKIEVSKVAKENSKFEKYQQLPNFFSYFSNS